MIVCGWCGHPTRSVDRCEACGHVWPQVPWEQRGEAVPQIRTDAAGRPSLDPKAIRRRLREAQAELGGTTTVAQLAEHLGVSDKTVRRWREMSG